MNRDLFSEINTESEIFPPQTHPANQSTEMEFKKLLYSFSKENEVLKEKVQNYEKKLVANATEIQDLTKQLKKITLERDHLKGMIQKFQIELADKDKILNISLSPMKRSKKAFDLGESDYIEEAEIKNIIEENVHDLNAKEILMQQYEKLEGFVSKQDELKEVVKKLREENKILKKKVEMFESEKIQIRLCVFCKDYYTPLNNSDIACKHHPGKLKYYSCRGCGGDEYYTCCNMCSKCKKGCKESKHVPMN